MPLIHPSDAALQRFAERAAGAERVAPHLEGCARCRERVMFARQIHERAAGLPPFDATDETLERVLASRAAQARVILPVDDDRPARTRPLLRAMALAASVILVAALAVQLGRGRAGTSPDDADLSNITSLFASTGLRPATAEARGVTQSTATPVRGRILAPMTLELNRRWVREVDGQPVITRAGDLIAVVEHLPGKDPTWLIRTLWTSLPGTPDVENARTNAESLYLSRDLLPLSRVVHVTPYRRFPGIIIAQRFVGDSIVGEMSLRDMTTRRPIARNLTSSHGRLVPSEALGPFFLMGVSLSPGWSADLDMLGWAVVPNDVVYPLTMRVAGSERITVPAGTYDCWKLEIRLYGQTVLAWLRKSDQVAVLIRSTAHDARGVREEVLVRETRPPTRGDH